LDDLNAFSKKEFDYSQRHLAHFMSEKIVELDVFSLSSIRIESDSRKAVLQYGVAVSELSSNLEQMHMTPKK